MAYCRECKHYIKKTDYRGVCAISKQGCRKVGSQPPCKRFCEGEHNPSEYTKENNLKTIMETIARCYKGGKWG